MRHASHVPVSSSLVMQGCSQYSVPRPTNLSPNFSFIQVPSTPPRLSKLQITPPHITSACIAHSSRPTYAPPAGSRLLVVFNDSWLRPPNNSVSSKSQTRRPAVPATRTPFTISSCPLPPWLLIVPPTLCIQPGSTKVSGWGETDKKSPTDDCAPRTARLRSSAAIRVAGA